MRLEIEPFVDDDEDGKVGSTIEEEEAESHVKQKCEVREFEVRYNLKGEAVTKVVESKAAKEETEVAEFAMTSTKTYSRDGSLESRDLEIYSPHIRTAFRNVIKSYPGVSLWADTIMIRGLPKCIFHYRKELAEYRDTMEDKVQSLHVTLALRFMETTLREKIKSYEALVESSASEPSIEFEDLWMIFRPGEYVCMKTLGSQRVMRFESMRRISGFGSDEWNIYATYVTHDGVTFGYKEVMHKVDSFEGAKPIRNLVVYPVSFCLDPDELCDRMVERGRKFMALRGNHHRAYDGLAFALGDKKAWDSNGFVDRYPEETQMVVL